jgi:diguanylate cyclase (GGDEF)-like protein
MTDHLTGIANRAAFDKAIAAELRYAIRSDDPFTVLCMDLDGFKDVNDRFGHAAGDERLCEAAARVVGQVRQEDVLARLGGDEFAVVLRHGDQNVAAALAQRIAGAMQQPFRLFAGDMVRVGISVGMASHSNVTTSVPALMAQADHALYEAKNRWTQRQGMPS